MKKYISIIIMVLSVLSVARADNIYYNPVQIKSNLTVTGNTSVQGITASATTLTGTANSSATFNQTGPFVASGANTLSGATVVGSTLTVNGQATFNDSFLASGATTLSGLTTISNTLTSSSTINSNGALIAAGANTLTGPTTVGNTLTLDSSAPVISSSSVSIGSGSVANASSLLDLSSTTKGMLPPRMTTTQRNAVSSPATGLVVYNTTTNELNLYDGGSWVPVGSGGGSFSDSYVRLNSPNGFGSTNTRIRRFTNAIDNVGTDITYADSATNGTSITVNSSGIYAFSYCEEGNTGAPLFGLSLNSASLTTNIEALTNTEIMALSNAGTGNDRQCIAWTGYLDASDVVRPHTNESGGGTFITANISTFTVSRVH